MRSKNESVNCLIRPLCCSIPWISPFRGKGITKGGLHPTTQMCYDLNDAFRSLNFDIYNEDEISSEHYAFDVLNFPPGHPARETMDTYWISGTENLSGKERLCLRPHLTGASVRYLQQHGARRALCTPVLFFEMKTPTRNMSGHFISTKR